MPTSDTDIGPFLLIFVAALLAVVLATPMVRRLAHRYSVLDAPSARKIHAHPLLLLGCAAGGVAAVAAVFFFLIATLTQQILVAPLAAVLVGACVGFLYYNFNPASIFMGDTGSLFLGFMLAAVGIKLNFPANTDIVTWMVPVLVLGVPLFA